MKKCFAMFLMWGVGMTGASLSQAAEAYPDPPGGWNYLYNGDQLQVGESGSGFTSLDGTWSHDNGSDQFDGSEIGGEFGPGNAPGGAILGTDGNITYLRMQATGDPRDYGYPDPSNRKIYFGHDISNDMDPVKANTILDDGVTLTFRARIPTPSKAGGPLDPLHRDKQQAQGPQPYPENGDGYVTSDGAKGNFVIRQGGDPNANPPVPAGAIAFSFTQTTDTPGGDPNVGVANFAGLTMNEKNGNVPTGNVDFGEGSATNLVAFDPTEWHELYIVIRKDPANIATHEAFVFVDGNLTPTVFKLTAGTGKDVEVDNFLATGGTATPQNWALDLDWYGFKEGAVFPPGAQLPPALTDVTPTDGGMFVPASEGIAFTASASMPGNTLPADGFTLKLNGADVSDQLTLTGSDSDHTRSATYKELLDNQLYFAEIVVTDSGGLSVTNVLSFDTFTQDGGLVVESEDYNEFNGFFIGNPLLGQMNGSEGTPDVDYSDTTMDSLGLYRPVDAVDTDTSGDVARQEFIDAGLDDYVVRHVVADEWLNYTREYPNGALSVYLRASAGAARTMLLEQVTGDTTQPDQTTTPLGLFLLPRTGNLNNYRYVPLTDALGAPQRVKLDGKATTRLTAVDAADDVRHNFLFFAPAADTGPITPWALSASPAPGAVGVPKDAAVEVTLQDGANALDPATIKLVFNGVDVTDAATVTDTPEGATVSFQPGSLSGGSTHTVELSYADTAGNTATRTWSFTVEGTPDNPATLTIQRDGANVIISWTPTGGTLEQSANLTDWEPVDGATSPATIPIGDGHMFYRVRQ